jgi:hypothetical protein
MASRGKLLIFAVACFGTALGCGARTDTLFDGESFGGSGDEGGLVTGGSQALGGSAGRAAGGSGAFPNGGNGAASSAGAGGSAPVAGYGGNGAVPNGGGGGSAPIAGAPFGGFGAVAGIAEAGAGGTSVVVQSCVAAAQSACNKCQCETCGSALDACVGDPSLGCAKIILCTQVTQCKTAAACYLACKDVIDANGGLAGNSLSQAFALGACAVNSTSSCGCN